MKRFGPTVALNGARITVRAGQTRALVGRKEPASPRRCPPARAAAPRTRETVSFGDAPAPAPGSRLPDSGSRPPAHGPRRVATAYCLRLPEADGNPSADRRRATSISRPGARPTATTSRPCGPGSAYGCARERGSRWLLEPVVTALAAGRVFDGRPCPDNVLAHHSARPIADSGRRVGNREVNSTFLGMGAIFLKRKNTPVTLGGCGRYHP